MLCPTEVQQYFSILLTVKIRQKPFESIEVLTPAVYRAQCWLLGSRQLPVARGPIQKEGLWHAASTTSQQ